MPTLRIAIVKEDKSRPYSWREKIDALRRPLDHLSSADVGLLVAPEYFFRYSWSTAAVSHFMSEADKRAIQGDLEALSKRYPNAILIPGTTAWRQPAAERSGLLGAVQSQGPGYFHGSVGVSQEEKFNRVVATNTGGAGSGGALREVRYNSAYVYSDGRRGAVDKRGDYKESRSSSVLVHDHDNPILDINVRGRTIRLGLEVCLDHAMGKLANHVDRYPGLAPDVHIILSDFATNQRQFFRTKPGGIVVHASTAARAVSPSHRYTEVALNGVPTGYWDSKYGAWVANPASRRLSPNPSGPVTHMPVPGTTMVSSSRPANRDSRVTNVFQKAGGGWRSLKVSHAPGHYFTVINALLA
ncbi:MAG: hypothetical protein ACRBN8_19330 [Nannocystales bacterium]